MLTCVYHPIDAMRVVEEDEGERLIASGVWFDSPVKATEYRNKVEKDVKKEKADKTESEKKKLLKPEDKLGEKNHER